MRSPYSDYSSNNLDEDQLGPLRELRSPISTNAIRTHMLGRAVANSLWVQLRSIAAEALILSAVGMTVWNVAAPVKYYEAPKVRVEPAVEISSLSSLPVVASFVHRNAIAGTYSGRAQNQPNVMGPGDKLTPTASAPSSPISSPSANRYDSRPVVLSAVAPEIKPDHRADGIMWFASVSEGALFSQVRMMDERFEVGFCDGWKTVAVAYSTGEGTRDARDELLRHPGLTAPLLSKESGFGFSVLFGTTIQAVSIGPSALELRAMAGPSYLLSSSAYYTAASNATASPGVFRGIGAAAEASALYRLNNFLECGITGTANYGSHQLTAGMYATLDIHFAQ